MTRRLLGIAAHLRLQIGVVWQYFWLYRREGRRIEDCIRNAWQLRNRR